MPLCSPSAAVTVMGAFYAQGQVVDTFGATTIGGYMANSFSFGKAVPSIYEVPTLADNLPQGMIGACSIRVVKTLSYREIAPG